MQEMVKQLKDKGLITNKNTTTKVDNNTTMLAKGNEPKANTSTEQAKTFTPEIKKVDNSSSNIEIKKAQPYLEKSIDSKSSELGHKITGALSEASNAIETKTKSLGEDVKSFWREQTKGLQEAKTERILSNYNKALSNVTEEEKLDMSQYLKKDGTYDFDAPLDSLYRQQLDLQRQSNDKLFTSTSFDNNANTQVQLEEIQKEINKFEKYKNIAEIQNRINEYDTYQIYGTEKEKADYNEAFSHSEDSFLERAVTGAGNVVLQTANEIPSAIDQMHERGNYNYGNEQIESLKQKLANHEISDEEFDECMSYWNAYIDDFKSNEDGISAQLDIISQQMQLNEYQGTNDLEKIQLEALDSTEQFLLHYGIGKLLSKAFGAEYLTNEGNNLAKNIYEGFTDAEKRELGNRIGKEGLITLEEYIKDLGTNGLYDLGVNATAGNISLATMGGMSATSKIKELLNEGYDIKTATNNGVLTGLISALTERIGVDNFVEKVMNGAGSETLGHIVTQIVSEGGEEDIESILDSVLDSMTLGKPLTIDGKELLMSFIVGGLSGGLTGVAGAGVNSVNASFNNVVFNIENRKQYNLIEGEIEKLESLKPKMSINERIFANDVIAKGREAMNLYEQNSKSGLSVLFSDEKATKTSALQDRETVANALTPEINNEVNFFNKINSVKQNVIESTQLLLDNKGYNVDAETYLSLNEKQKHDSIVASEFAKKTRTNVYITSGLPEGFNGYVSDGTIVIDGTKKPILTTLSHELTHGTESSKYYATLDKLVSNNFAKTSDVDAEVERIRKIYNSKGIDIDTEGARKEFVAKQIEELLGNEKFINDLVNYDTSIASKIYQDLVALGNNDETIQIKNAFEKAFTDANFGILEDGTLFSAGDFEEFVDDVKANPKNYRDNNDGSFQIGIKALDYNPSFVGKGKVANTDNYITVITPSALADFYIVTGAHSEKIGVASDAFIKAIPNLIDDPLAVVKEKDSKEGKKRYGLILDGIATEKGNFAPMYAIYEPYQGRPTSYKGKVGEDSKIRKANTVVAIYPLNSLVDNNGVITKDRLQKFFMSKNNNILYSSVVGKNVENSSEYKQLRQAIEGLMQHRLSNRQFSIDTDTYTMDWGNSVPNPLNVDRSKYKNWKVSRKQITNDEFLNYDVNGKTIDELIEVGERAREWLLAPEIEKLRVAEDYDLNHLSEDGMNYIKKMDEIAKALPFTISDNSEERIAYRNDQLEQYKNEFFIDKDIPKERKAWIELGVSGGGKSKFIEKQLKANGGLIDSDELKFMSKEFKKYGGLYSNALHAESDMLSKQVRDWAMDEGYNLIFPLVGRNEGNVKELIDNLKAKGYTEIHLGGITIPLNKSTYRVANRFIEDDRYLPNFYAVRADNETRNPIKTYYDLRNTEGVIDDGLWNTDVPFGQDYERVNADSKDGYGNGSLQQEKSGVNSTRDNGRDRNSGSNISEGLSNQINESKDSFSYGTQEFASSNLLKSEVLTDEQKEKVRKRITNGLFTYSKVFNETEYNEGKKRFETNGLEKTFENYMNNNAPSYKTVVDGEILLQELARNNDPRLEEVEVKMADDATAVAQTLQAYAILQRMTPEGQLRAIERSMNRMQRDIDNRLGNDAPRLQISEELKNNLRNARTQEEMAKARDAIANDLEKQKPITVTDMIDSWRYLAMLGNPRTHIRNILGNAVFVPVVNIKNAIGTGLENMLSSKLKLQYKTKSILTNSEVDKARLDEGRRVYDDVKENLEKGNKYEHKDFTEKTFVGKTLNKISEFNTKALDKEDFAFSSKRFAKSYAEFMKANNLTVGNMTEDMIKRATAYATLESQKATYRDANAVAEWFNELEYSNKKGLKMASYAKRAIIPFTKTPMNIIKRGVEYSPVGLLKTITYGAYELSKGKVDANTYLDNMASGITGTMIAGLGALLASMGIFRTKDDDKERKEYFDKENGEQEYSIDLSPLGIKGTYTIDWATPTIMPFAIGAELFNAFEELEGIDGFGSAINAVLDISAKVFDPIMETSMLSSLKDSLQSYASSGGEWVGNMVVSLASSYIQQLFPTLGGQIARTIDDTRRTTYPNDGIIDKIVKQVLNKIPFASKLNEAYINKQGQEEKTEDLGIGPFGRFILNTLSPGYYSSKDIDEYDEEMYRLYEKTGDIDVLPSSTSTSTTYDKETYKFTDAQYTQWHKERYQTETKYVNEFIDSSAYKNLSDEARADVIANTRKYAQMVAKDDFLKSVGKEYTDETYEKVKGALDNGVKLYEYYLTGDYYNSLKEAEGDQPKSDYINYLNDSDMSDDAKQYMYGLQYGKSKVYGYIEDLGYDSKTKLAMYEILADTISDKDADGKTVSNSKAQKIKEQYIKLGVYNDIIKYINEHDDVNYNSFGLSKTVVGSSSSKDTYTNAYSKVLGSNKASVETNSSKTNSSTNTLKNTSSVSKNGSNINKDTFSTSYSKAMTKDSNTVTCPKCGKNVVPVNGKCPVCGYNL